MIEPTELSPLNWACDITLESYFFQIQTNSREGSIMWSEAGQQTNEAKEVYCVKKYIFYFIKGPDKNDLYFKHCSCCLFFGEIVRGP